MVSDAELIHLADITSQLENLAESFGIVVTEFDSNKDIGAALSLIYKIRLPILFGASQTGAGLKQMDAPTLVKALMK